MLRPALAIVVFATLALICCGNPAHGTEPATSSSPSRDAAVFRPVQAGERITFRSGLTVTVPPGFRGELVGRHDLGSLDGLIPRTAGTASFETLMRSRENGGQFKWPLVAVSKDGTVEVRHVAARPDTAKGFALTSVIIRLPGHPTGLVMIDRHGKQAVDDPGKVMALLESVWKRFNVQGASLPSPE